MSSSGADALKAALRRSLPIMIALVVLGVVAVNLFKHLQGPRYQASSRVEISATPLAQIITGTQPGFVDPQRVQDTAQALAQSSRLYQLAAHPGLGSASDLQGAVTVSAVPDTDILEFSATDSDSNKAMKIANAVAQAYTTFRAQLSGSQVQGTIQRLQSSIGKLPPGSPQRTQAQQELSRLQLLAGANSSDAVQVQQGSAVKTSPSPAKDSLLGFSIGLIIALIVVAVREAVDTTVRTESDIEDVLAAPVLVSVRSLPRRAQFVTMGRYESMFADTYALLAAQVTPAEGSDQGLVLAVTSALAREGKTTTTANLAVAAAQRGADVLLADFDFRKGTLSRVFEVPESAPGALQLLDGTAELDDALWDVSLDGPKPSVFWSGTSREKSVKQPAGRGVQAAGGSNGHGAREVGTLRLLPTGGNRSLQKIGHREQLATLLRDMRSQADLVILDTPPALLTVEMTELAQLIDTVLVVVRQGRVSHRTLRSLSRHTRAWPAELAGAVLTDMPAVGEYGAYYGSR